MTSFTRRPISEIASVTGGGTPNTKMSEFWDGSIPWVSPKDMKTREIFDSEKHISEAALAASACKLIEPPAVLFVVRGMILAHTFPVAVTRVPVAINQDMKALTPREGVDADYLAFVLSGASHELLSKVEIAGHGTRRLKSSVWEGLEVPLPEVAEQQRIAALAQECLNRIDEVRRLHEEAGREAKRFGLAVLRKAFDGEL